MNTLDEIDKAISDNGGQVDGWASMDGKKWNDVVIWGVGYSAKVFICSDKPLNSCLVKRPVDYKYASIKEPKKESE